MFSNRPTRGSRVFLALATFLLVATVTLVGATFEAQSAASDVGTAVSVTLTGVAEGETVVLAMGFRTNLDQALSVAPASDLDGALSEAVVLGATEAQQVGIYYITGASAGTHVITATLSASAGWYANAQRFSAASAVALEDFASSNNTVSGTTFNTGSATLTGNGFVVTMGMTGGYGRTKTPATGFTGLTQIDPDDRFYAQYRTAGAGTYDGAYTLSVADTGRAVIAAFQEGGAPPSGPPSQRTTTGVGKWDY